MPKDYNLDVTPANQQRRKENAMSDEWTRAFLSRAPIGHVATRWDDQPFITPTNFWYDVDRHVIYFHSNIVGRIRANAEQHDRVCFEASEFGRFLPSNVAIEFSIQYESVVSLALNYAKVCGIVQKIEISSPNQIALNRYFVAVLECAGCDFNSSVASYPT